MDKSNFIFKGDKLSEFTSVIDDLSKISKVIKIKITDNNLMLYTIDTAGESSSTSQSVALAVKSYSFPPENFMKFKYYDDGNDTSHNVDWIIRNGSILNKKIKFFGEESNIKGVFNLRKLPDNPDTHYTRNVIMTDGKFKFSITGDEPHVIRDMSLDQLNQILDPSSSDLSFSIPTKEFEDARTASNIESEDVVTIYIKEGKIYFRQSSWELL